MLTLVLAYRYVDRLSTGRAAVMGVAIGLAALTRSDALLLLLVLVAPLVWLVRGGRVRASLACAGAAIVVLSPWLVRNAVTLDRFPLLSTDAGSTALGANCDVTYHGDLLGSESPACQRGSACTRRAEVPRNDCQLREARSYARRNLRRVPIVVLARVERTWEAYDPRANLDRGVFLRGRPKGWATAGLVFYLVLVPAAFAGAYLLRRRPVLLVPLVAMFVQVSVVSATTFGESRYRAAAEPALVVLAAVAFERAGRSLVRARRGSRSSRGEPRRGGALVRSG